MLLEDGGFKGLSRTFSNAEHQFMKSFESDTQIDQFLRHVFT